MSIKVAKNHCEHVERFIIKSWLKHVNIVVSNHFNNQMCLNVCLLSLPRHRTRIEKWFTVGEIYFYLNVYINIVGNDVNLPKQTARFVQCKQAKFVDQSKFMIQRLPQINLQFLIDFKSRKTIIFPSELFTWIIFSFFSTVIISEL